MKIEGSVIWVTGASSGIGEALAYELSRKGALLILSARRVEVLEKVRKACLHPEKVQVLPLDLEQTEELESKSNEALQFYGHIDILVNNAGISQRSLARDTQLSVDQRIMQIDYLGTVALTKAILPSMLTRKKGQIVTVTSMVGKYGTPMRSGYSAAKHALHGFMDSLRAEEERNGLLVTLVCPGFVSTNVSKNALTADGSAQNTMDAQTQKGIEPDVFAQKMTKAIAANKQEVYIAGAKEKLGLLLKKFFPKVFNKMVQKLAVT